MIIMAQRVYQPHDTDEGPQFNYQDYPEESFKYLMNFRFKGFAVIINNSTFINAPQLNPRYGSEEDVEALRQSLVKRGFRHDDIQVCSNLTKLQTIQLLEKVSREDFTEYGCLVIAFLSYGGQSRVWATDALVSYQELLMSVTNDKIPSLFDKPKFLLIQTELDPNLDGISHDAPVPSNSSISPSTTLTAPDVLVAYALDPTHISWRTDRMGTHFVQRFCEVMNLDGGRLDMVELLTRVNQMVRLDKGGYVQATNAHRIYCPRIISLLTKHFKLG